MGEKIPEIEPKEEENLKLTFSQKWILKKFLKKTKKAINKQRKYMLEISKQHNKISKEQEKELEEFKIKLIEGILGDEEKNITGFIDIYEIKKEDGEEITRQDLMNTSIEEITELSEDLTDRLREEI